MSDRPGKTRRERILELLAEDPGDPFLRYGLAMDHIGAGEYAEADRCFQQLLQDRPDYVPAYLHAARVLHELGRDDEARELGRRGVVACREAKDEHAAEELEFFLDGLG
jgi:tetratricopeptide (TPR) repeat protein